MLARPPIRRSSRSGLAPLELVLSLPILLFLMALAINFGNAACWKLRAANVARNAVWSTRWPRGGLGTVPQPPGWPAAGSRGVAGAGNVQALYDGSIDQPVVRGPTLGQPPNQVNVFRDLLDPTRGLMQGTSSIRRSPPLMPSWRQFNFNLVHQLLDDGFQFTTSRMGGLWQGNNFRREAILYDLLRLQSNTSLVTNYTQAAIAVYMAATQPPLITLDHDPEIFAVMGYYQDFHPYLGTVCSLDKQMVHETYVLPLVDRIQSKPQPRVAGVPENMARFFLSMYQREKQLLQAELATLPPDERGPIQAQLSQIDTYIGQLNTFLGQLQ